MAPQMRVLAVLGFVKTILLNQSEKTKLANDLSEDAMAQNYKSPGFWVEDKRQTIPIISDSSEDEDSNGEDDTTESQHNF